MGSIMLKRLILVSFLCALTLAGARASERITRFVSDVDVQRNGDLLVTETIQVRAEGDAIRHGILRDFPTTYRAKDGTRVVGRLRRAGGQARRRARALRHRARRKRRAHPHRRRQALPQRRPARVPHQISHHAPDRLLQGFRRIVLERHRQRLDLPDRRGGSAHHAARARRVQADRALHRPARRCAARTRPSSSSSPAASCSAPPRACLTATG